MLSAKTLKLLVLSILRKCSLSHALRRLFVSYVVRPEAPPPLPVSAFDRGKLPHPTRGESSRSLAGNRRAAADPKSPHRTKYTPANLRSGSDHRQTAGRYAR